MKLRLLGLLLLLASGAFADFTLHLDTELRGSTPLVGSPAWVTATFHEIARGVQLVIDTLNLTDSEFISKFYFNFDPAKNSALFLPGAPAANAQTVNGHLALKGREV